ncbi:MAG TPA: phosphopantetheine-binding protein, partial [Tepidisphaeraceae bacterium]|nr:phosphopantetheine-binding protein [Tepidisphaeraceae bacterium]
MGEIETVLLQHPTVTAAVAIARDDAPGEERLVAYVVGRDGAASASELREFLRSKLPDYMVPSAFVPLDEIPLTPNGKVDRNALPAPEPAQADLQERLVRSITDVEKSLIAIWCDLLAPKQVGVHDNFFELGGHSLLAVRLQSRLEKQFGT